MTYARLFRVLEVATIGLALSVILNAQTGEPLVAIQAKLSSQFKVTTTTADRSDIVVAGDVVQLHKPGLVMYAVASPMPPANSYKNGKIGQGMRGFGKDFVIGMMTPGAGTAAGYPHRQFVPEDNPKKPLNTIRRNYFRVADHSPRNTPLVSQNAISGRGK